MYDMNKYLKKEKTKVSQEVNKKIKIYLDTKYWVDICDVTRGVKKNDDINKIYTFLKNKVKNNEVICPISEVLFKEVLRQSDKDSLTHTLKIIDELSQGIIICSEKERFSLELYNFFYHILEIETDEVLRENFWCKGVINIYGLQIPDIPNFTDEIKYTLQRNLYDEVQRYSFLDYFNKVGMDKLKVYRNSKTDIDWFNENKQKYNIEKFKTPHQLHMFEIDSSIRGFYKDHIEKIFKEVLTKQIKYKEEESMKREFHLRLIYTYFDKQWKGLYLPSLDIGAMLHSKIVWNKTQKFKPGDINDFGHATTALPYYDYFFTEKSLHNMIKECKYDEKYSCTVASKNNEILDILEKLNLS